MNSSIDNNINDIAYFVGSKSFGDVNGTMLFEALFEFMSGFSFIAIAVGHFALILW
jgi:hypothetical protein